MMGLGTWHVLLPALDTSAGVVTVTEASSL